MGTYNKGILGAFSGKVGPVVGASWRGKEVMRSLPKKGNRVPTATQLLQRQKFAMVQTFLSGISPVVKRYYGSNSGLKTRGNNAMSYLMREALVFTDPDFEWDYSKVLISRGDLTGIEEASVDVTPGEINVMWADNSEQGEALADDKLVLLVYDPESKAVVYSLAAGERADEATSLAMPSHLEDAEVQVWATFVSADEKLAATSLYLGAVTVI
jgi:hypothetical protein